MGNKYDKPIVWSLGLGWPLQFTDWRDIAITAISRPSKEVILFPPCIVPESSHEVSTLIIDTPSDSGEKNLIEHRDLPSFSYFDRMRDFLYPTCKIQTIPDSDRLLQCPAAQMPLARFSVRSIFLIEAVVKAFNHSTSA